MGVLFTYQNKNIVLTTKHNKEIAIDPQIKKFLGAKVLVPNVDTDALGTFTGEIERKGSALEVAKSKALLGIEKTGLEFGIASEGSFGAHPSIPFIASNQEILVFIDRKNGFTLHEQIISEKTNYIQKILTCFEDIEELLSKAKFPSHALIVRPNNWTDKQIIFKGITNLLDLEYAYKKSFDSSNDRKVYVQTDMRANFNPSRMQVISELAERFAKRLSSHCPSCYAPGWGVIDFIIGLPCELCGTPTEMIAYELFGCTLCKYNHKELRKDGLLKANPMYCDVCNP